jgi:hypothetical protein
MVYFTIIGVSNDFKGVLMYERETEVLALNPDHHDGDHHYIAG